MHCTVKRLRKGGARLSDREIAAAPSTDGMVTFVSCAGVYQLKLHAPDDSQQKPLLPVLYHARLTTMHTGKMLFHGIEQSNGGAEYEQEWTLVVRGA